MVYLDPTNDIAFKKLFGNITHKSILISFLNSVLERTGDDQIVDVTFNDPSNVPETPLSKESIVDVRCTDQRNNHYILEMQVLDKDDYAPRAQYYSSIGLSRQLAKKELYKELMPVIFVGVLNLNLFKGNHYLSHHLILDSKTQKHELKHLEFHFIELKKFDKTLEQLATIQDKWIYFLKHAEDLEKVPAPFKNPTMEEAFDVLEQSNWSMGELDAYSRYLDAIRCAASELDTAIRKNSREIAKKLLDVLDVNTIAQITGLTIAQVEELKKSLK